MAEVLQQYSSHWKTTINLLSMNQEAEVREKIVMSNCSFHSSACLLQDSCDLVYTAYVQG